MIGSIFMPDDSMSADVTVALGVAASAIRVVASAEREKDLYDGVCGLLVQDAGYALAWVGLARDDATRSVEAVASRGVAHEYVAAVNVSWADTERGHGPTGRAIRSGDPAVLNEFARASGYGPWLAQAEAHGFAASAAFPIRAGDQVVGALNVYSRAASAFGELECALVCDVALALSMGLTRLRHREASIAAAAELQLARDNLAAIYDATPDMVFVHRADGALVHVNKQAEGFYGAPADVICQALPERLMGEGHTMEEAAHHVRQAIEHGADDFTWVGRKMDGTTFPCEVRLRRLPGERQSPDEPHVVGVTRDLTDLVRLQDELVSMQRLESLAVLARGIAHDFNNLLACVSGNIELASRQADLTDSTRDLLGEARDSAIRARASSLRLLGFARGGPGRRERVGLASLIRDVSTVVFAGQSAVALDLPDECVAVDADRDKLAQVFDNLFRNALEASPDGAQVRVSWSGDAGSVTITVADDGSGVDPAIATHIFDPFFTTKENGVGLGLSSAFGVVRRHGGRLEFVESDGSGATFRVTLPLARTARRAAAPFQPAVAGATKRRALVMDDEEGLRRLFARMLESVGFECVTAPDGDAALALAREAVAAGQPIALALLDLTVPAGLGGHEILPELRATQPDLKIVAATGYADSDARAADFDAFLSKPFGLADLRSEVDRLFPDEG